MAEQRAWVTLATNDAYCLGALVLAHSLQKVGTKHPIVIMITPSVTPIMKDRLASVFAQVVTVDVLDSKDAAHLALLARPELGITFTKLHCWTLEQYNKCVFLDADTLVFQNCDELFDREELSAAPDVGWPDCFNSGVFVFRPSKETFDSLIKFAQEHGSFDGGDQGLLNQYFSDWARGDINKHLPFLYNVCSTAFYSYLPALNQYGRDMKIMHFIGNVKPWLQKFNWSSKTVADDSFLKAPLQYWWDLFIDHVHPKLDVAMARWECGASNEARYTSPQDDRSPFPWHRPPVPTLQESSTTPRPADFYDPWESYAPAPAEAPTPPSPQCDTPSDRPDYAADCTNIPDSQPINQIIPWYENTLSTLSKDEDDEVASVVSNSSARSLDRSESEKSDYLECNAQQDCEPDDDFGCCKAKFEEVRPRHPYDNYYLNHKTVVDQSGCKRCSHEELPPAPSPSPTPSVDTEPDLQAGIAGALSQLTIGVEPESGSSVEEHLRRQGWEAGHIDYMGADSFTNIWAKISQTLNNVPKPEEPIVESEPARAVPQDIPKVSSEPSAPLQEVVTVSAEAKEEKPVETPTEAPAVTEPQAAKEEHQDSKQEEDKPPTHRPEVTCPVKPERLICHLKPAEEVEALLTPENEHEDADSIAASIIKSEIESGSPDPSPAKTEPPPVSDLQSEPSGLVSLAQIGIVPSKCPEPEAECPLKVDELCCLIKSSPDQTQEAPKTETVESTVKQEEPPTATPVPKSKKGSKKSQAPIPVDTKPEPSEAPVCPIAAKTEEKVTEAPICPIPVKTDDKAPLCQISSVSKKEETPVEVCSLPAKSEEAPAEVCPMPVKTVTEVPACPIPDKSKKAQKKEVAEAPICPVPTKVEKDQTAEPIICHIPTAPVEVAEAPVCPVPTKPKKTQHKKDTVVEAPACPIPTKEQTEVPICPSSTAEAESPICPVPTKPKKAQHKKETVAEPPVCLIPKAEQVEAPACPTPSTPETPTCPVPTKPKKTQHKKEAAAEAPTITKSEEPAKSTSEKKETATEAPTCPLVAETKVVEEKKETEDAAVKPKKVVKKTPKPKLEQSGSVEEKPTEAKKSEEMPVPPPRKKEKKPKESKK